MSKSSIKTKTVLTMTDMTQSTELRAFKRTKDGYKFTVKIPFCICVVLSWDELKVWQNFLDSDYEIHMVRPGRGSSLDNKTKNYCHMKYGRSSTFVR